MRGRHGKSEFGVVTVIDEEFAAARAALSARTRWRGSGYWHGSGGPERFVLVRMADRGNVAASMTTRALIEHWQPNVVLLVGIAGGLAGAGSQPGDVVIPDYVHYGDFRKLTEAGDVLRFAAYDQPTVSLRANHVEGLIHEEAWMSRLTHHRPVEGGELRRLIIGARRRLPRFARASEASPSVRIGALVAGEKILGDPDHPEQERVFVTFDHAIAVDMESYGVARAVHDARFEPTYNPRLSIVRGISDMVYRPARPSNRDEPAAPDGRPEGTKVEINDAERARWKIYAASAAAAFAAELVDEMGR